MDPMSLVPLFFYLFATLTLGSAAAVITVRNPVHAVLFLILAFFNAAGLFLLLGAEFLATVLVVVYVGAVAVLFLFVVMMLDVDFAVLKQGFLDYLPVGLLVGGVILLELILIVGAYSLSPDIMKAAAVPMKAGVSNTAALGQVLYTKYMLVFQVAGLVLLVAMIGAIVLTLHHRRDVKRQDITKQVMRNPKSGMQIIKVQSGKGLSQ